MSRPLRYNQRPAMGAYRFNRVYPCVEEREEHCWEIRARRGHHWILYRCSRCRFLLLLHWLSGPGLTFVLGSTLGDEQEIVDTYRLRWN